jgi:hypothetical protein
LGGGSELVPLRGLAHLALLLMNLNSRDHLDKELVLWKIWPVRVA